MDKNFKHFDHGCEPCDFKELIKKINCKLPDNNRQEITARDLRDILKEITHVTEDCIDRLEYAVKKNTINIQFVDQKLSKPNSIYGDALVDGSVDLSKLKEGGEQQVISTVDGKVEWKNLQDIIDDGTFSIDKLTKGEYGFVLTSTEDGVEWKYVIDVVDDGTVESVKIKAGEEGQVLTSKDGKTVWRDVKGLIGDGSFDVKKLTRGDAKQVLASTEDSVEWSDVVGLIDTNSVPVDKLQRGDEGKVLSSTADGIEWKEAVDVIPEGSIDLDKFKKGEIGQIMTTGEDGAKWADLKDIINIENGEGDGSLQQISNAATGMFSFAEGNDNTASGFAAHAEGHHTVSTKHGSHSEGKDTKANADYSHAEGSETETRGENSHAEGYKTIAYGDNSHVEGEGTQALNKNEHAEGQYNKSNHETHEFGHAENTMFSIGIGTEDLDRKNAFELMQNGDIYVYGMGEYDGTNARDAESKTLQSVMQGETERALEAEKALDEKIEAETARATEVEGDLQSQLTAEVERATAKEDELDQAIKSEQSRAESSEQALRTSIDGITIVREDDGSYEANHADIYHLEVDGQQKGEKIVIRKDNTLRKVYLGHVDDTLQSEDSEEVISGTGNTALCFIYYVNGKYELVAVDIEDFLSEAEFKDGLIVENHEVRVRINTTSEGFLTVSAEGVKLAGVQAAIDAKVKEEDDRASEAERVLDGKIDAEKVRAESAEGVLDGKIEAINDKLDAGEDDQIFATQDGESKWIDVPYCTNEDIDEIFE